LTAGGKSEAEIAGKERKGNLRIIKYEIQRQVITEAVIY